MYLARINSIVRLRFNSDGVGVRTTVFFQGCPLKCQWCCNPETRIESGFHSLTVNDLFDIVSGDKIYFDASRGGVTFSGGEPLIQSEFIKSFLSLYGSEFKANIETSLWAERSHIEMLIPYIDHWFVDLKLMNNDDHIHFTGVSNNIIKDNLLFLSKNIDPKNITAAFPIITGINDSVQNVEEMIAFLKKCDIEKIELHPYRKSSEIKYQKLNLPYQNIDELPKSTLKRITEQLQNNGIKIIKRDTLLSKRKCEALKNIRKSYSKKMEIELDFDECTFKGECCGTCEKCEQELDFINKWRLHNEK